MILVDVYVPSVDDKYDFMLDDNTLIKEVISELSEIIAKKMKSEIPKSEDFLLYDVNSGQKLDSSQTLFECGINNGRKLMLI